jgi:hypothetical protein
MSEDVKTQCKETNLQAVQRWAAENDLKVVFPDAYELQIDIDSSADAMTFEQNIDVIENSHGILNVKVTPSRSGGKRKHFTVRLITAVHDPVERIALQAILGSDRRREANSLRRWREGEKTPTLFFEKK